MRDKYTKEIRVLRKIYNQEGTKAFQDAVNMHWNAFYPLFESCARPRAPHTTPCLTQVKRGGPVSNTAFGEQFTRQIRNDPRIPDSPEKITHPDQLRVFAEYQRQMDRMAEGEKRA